MMSILSKQANIHRCMAVAQYSNRPVGSPHSLLLSLAGHKWEPASRRLSGYLFFMGNYGKANQEVKPKHFFNALIMTI